MILESIGGLSMLWRIYRFLWKICAWVVMVVLAGCAAQQMPRPMPTPKLRTAPFHETALTCEQANRISYRVVEQLGYKVTSFTPATGGGSGMVKGDRAPYQVEGSLNQDTVTVKITCDANGVYVDAKPGGPGNANFPAAFFVRFRDIAEIIRRGEAPKPPGQVQVVMKPLVGLETKLEFGTAVAAVLPVRVEVFNTTTRTYELDVDRIVLLTPSGERVKPLKANGGAFPAPPLSSQALAPGDNIKGYLYYPPGAYTGTRGFLIEKESQEREGFNVQF